MQTRTHSIDFAKSGDAEYDRLANAFEGLDVGVLVNNVGKSHNMPAYLIDTPQDEIKDIVAINVNATVKVTYIILPGMVARYVTSAGLSLSHTHNRCRKRGLILNVGSFAGAVASPMLAVYSGTKAFLSKFSDAIGEEVRKDGIVVEHLNTYFVVSGIGRNAVADL